MSVSAVPDEPTASPSSGEVAALAARAAGGDVDAEVALLRRFAPVVRAFARRRLPSRDAVHDFTQDVLLVLLEALRSAAIAEPAALPGFVLGICRNLARDRARAGERRAELWERHGAAFAVLEAEAPERDGYALAKLEDCVSHLSGRAREVVRLAYVDGLESAAIAARLAMSEGNVRVVRHRALRALRECLDAPAPTEVR